MKYEIYCDESCIEAIFNKNAHKYAVIGGIWIPAEKRQELKNSITEIKKKFSFLGEAKWNKIAPSNVEMYKAFVTLFFQNNSIRFRSICIKAEEINHNTFNNGNGELGFYKFYFQLVHNWLIGNNEYSLFLDHKINGNRNRVNDLRKILQKSTTAQIQNAQALPSEESVLIQLADILTGAVAASMNNELRIGSAKDAVAKEISQNIHHAIQATLPSEHKFNVFDINLRKEW